MNESVAALVEVDAALDSLADAWRAALGSCGGTARADDDVALMADAGLLAVNAALGAARRHIDAIHAHVAAAIATRSRPELGSGGLARRSGHRTPALLVASTTGGHAGDAARLIQAGEATTGRVTFTGERAAPRHPHVAAALRRGRVSVAAAAAIAAMLDRVATRVTPDRLSEAEATLADQAASLSLADLSVVLTRAHAWLDPDGVEAKVDDLRTRRSLHLREDAEGMLSLTARLDPESAAPVKAAIDAIVGSQLRESREASVSESGGRSVAQLRADALTDVCRHALGCEEATTPLVNTTVVVRIPLDALISGTGIATIDGIAQPIDAATARRMAGDAEIIPCVLGGESEVLDFGRARRLSTRAQKLALVERDGGCAFCGAPPAYTEGHHIRWWERHRGETDLRNLILLCTRCHHQVHSDGWEIRIDPPPSGDVTGGSVWFVPPPEVDPARIPRPGGRRRFDFRSAA